MQRNLDLDFAVFRADIFETTPGDQDQPYHPFSFGDDLLRFLSHECVWQTNGPVWRRQFLRDLGGFDEMLPSMQDLNLHIRAIVADGQYVRVNEFDHDIRGISARVVKAQVGAPAKAGNTIEARDNRHRELGVGFVGGSVSRSCGVFR